MNNNENIEKIYNFLSLLSDKKRLKIIYKIGEDSLCVGDIATSISETIANTSYRLQQLKKGNIVNSEKRGKEVYYFLADAHIHIILNNIKEHINHELKEKIYV